MDRSLKTLTVQERVVQQVAEPDVVVQDQDEPYTGVLSEMKQLDKKGAKDGCSKSPLEEYVQGGSRGSSQVYGIYKQIVMPMPLGHLSEEDIVAIVTI